MAAEDQEDNHVGSGSPAPESGALRVRCALCGRWVRAPYNVGGLPLGAQCARFFFWSPAAFLQRWQESDLVDLEMRIFYRLSACVRPLSRACRQAMSNRCRPPRGGT